MERFSIDGRVVPTINGGHGSGNFGHSGRPGKVGGSGKGDGIKVHEGSEETDYYYAEDGDRILASGKTKEEALKKAKEKQRELDELMARKDAENVRKAIEAVKMGDHGFATVGEAAKYADKSRSGGETADKPLSDWAKDNITYAEDLSGSNKSFDEVLQGMYDGEQFYDIVGNVDSVDREKIFTEMAKRTGLDYDDIYEVWLHGSDRTQLPRDNVNYQRMVEGIDNVEFYLKDKSDYRKMKDDTDTLISGDLSKKAHKDLQASAKSKKADAAVKLYAEGAERRIGYLEDALRDVASQIRKARSGADLQGREGAYMRLSDAQAELKSLSSIAGNLQGATKAYVAMLDQQTQTLAQWLRTKETEMDKLSDIPF